MTQHRDLHLDQAATAAALSSAALATAHVCLWPFQLRRLEAYTVGTALLGTGVTYYALATRQPGAAIAFWLCAGCGGATVASAWRLRRWLDEERASAATQGALAEALEAIGPG